ncbi:hypothetical protein ACO0RG_004764 [Hanseniaspora osmophila]|uniref:Transgelin n=1 Tax=Hanseniaspora osmophila TaxID=56408 RepID=A0A1E5S0C5_9ASCO|nr:Transgelin [Hanseniaspora osmophila]
MKDFGHPGKADVTSLDEDLLNKRSAKFTQENINEIQNWIFNDILHKVPESQDQDLIDLLKDGCVLCELANVLSAGSDSVDGSEAPLIKYKKSAMPFVQMEQISLFLQFAQQYGVPQDELFSTVDLYENKDPAQVYQTLKSLSRYANAKNPANFPVLGPQLAQKRQAPLKPKKPSHLTNASWSTMEFGYMKGANQKTEKISIGTRRNITSD